MRRDRSALARGAIRDIEFEARPVDVAADTAVVGYGCTCCGLLLQRAPSG